MQGEDTKRDWLSVPEVAEAMGLSEMTLYRAIAGGEFPAVRIGRRLFVPARALDRMADLAITTGREVSAAEISGEAS